MAAHRAARVSTIDEDAFRDGIMFDGSSIAGWKAINESDMILMPDASTAVLDPFAAKPSLILICDIVEPIDRAVLCARPAQHRQARRGVCQVHRRGRHGDGRRRRRSSSSSTASATALAAISGMYQIDSQEGPQSGVKEYADGNMGHRPGIKGGYFPVPPVDSESDLRAEMLSTMGEMGLTIEKHHHEVAQSQHELGTRFATLTKMADQMQIYKYCVHNVAHSYGKTATFMPKPIYGDNGTGMHTHQSIWKEGKPLFAGNAYADLSETCLHFIGGIIKHAKAINAFSNPSTNSYKRLIPGFEAPVLLAYSARNRSASCRIPYTASPKAKRVEMRFPDPSANPYLSFSAILMAGLDGIKNKIHPGDPMDKDLYDLPPEELKGIPTVCGSLREALGALEADHEFLMAGDVFSRDQIDSYIELKWTEVYRFEHTPHPVEFEMYYSV